LSIQRSLIFILTTTLILLCIIWILWIYYPEKKRNKIANGHPDTGYLDFEQVKLKDEGYDCTPLQPVIPARAGFYSSGPWVPGSTITVLWEFEKPWLIPCIVKVYITKVEIESGSGKKIQLTDKGSFPLRLPETPGVYAFPITFSYLERKYKATEGRTWKNETDILYFVPPPGATCEYNWFHNVNQIPHKITFQNGSWLAQLNATQAFPSIKCSNGKFYPFRGTFKYVNGSWYVRKLPPDSEIISAMRFKTEGLSNADLENIAKYEVKIQNAGNYEAGFCLTSFYDKGGNETLYVELLKDSFPFTDPGWSDCWRQEIHLPPSK